jgi:hypothetical protein
MKHISGKRTPKLPKGGIGVLKPEKHYKIEESKFEIKKNLQIIGAQKPFSFGEGLG